jgi:acetyl-CoA carboxylase biotin carboxyl carrier protein
LDFKEIKQIVDLIKRSGLTEFELEEKDFKLKICRKGDEVQPIYQTTTPMPFPQPPASMTPAPVAAGQSAPPASPEAPADAKVDESKVIRSPMVGTFYAAPSPDSPSFVKVSDTVGEDTVVCILEAMKVMNEIKAETKGVISEILVENGESVEYGQPLFRLK